MKTLRSILAAAFALLAGAVRAQDGAPAPEAIASLLAKELTSHFGLEGDLQLEMTRPWTPATPVGQGWSLSVVGYPPTPASTMIVRCQIRDASGSVQEPTFVVRASLWRDTWCVKTPIRGGEDFDASRLEARRTDVLAERDVVPASLDVSGYIFARSVPVVRLLTWHDLGKHPLVRKGETVLVTATEGLLNVSMKALALESGAQGDTISVRNTESQKIFSALVTDENHVQVQF